MKPQRHWIKKHWAESKMWGITIPEFKLHFKMTVIKAVLYWPPNRHVDCHPFCHCEALSPACLESLTERWLHCKESSASPCAGSHLHGISRLSPSFCFQCSLIHSCLRNCVWSWHLWLHLMLEIVSGFSSMSRWSLSLHLHFMDSTWISVKPEVVGLMFSRSGLFCVLRRFPFSASVAEVCRALPIKSGHSLGGCHSYPQCVQRNFLLFYLHLFILFTGEHIFHWVCLRAVSGYWSGTTKLLKSVINQSDIHPVLHNTETNFSILLPKCSSG